MKHIKTFLLVLALLACGQAVALAAAEQQHDAVPAAQEPGAKDEAAAHEHEEG